MLTRRQTQAANHTFPLLALLALTLALLLPLVQARFLISELSVDGTTLSETDRLKYVRDMGDRDVGATRGNNILACNAGGAPAVSLRLPVFAEADIQIKGKLYSTSGIFTVTAAVQYENSVAGTFLLPPNMVTYNFDPTVIPWSLSDGVWKLPGNDNYNLTLGTLSRFVRATPFTIQVTYKDVSNVEYRQCIDMIVTGARYVGGGVGLAVNGWAVLVVAVVALLV